MTDGQINTLKDYLVARALRGDIIEDSVTNKELENYLAAQRVMDQTKETLRRVVN